MRFSTREIQDLLLAWVFISVAVAFAFPYTGAFFLNLGIGAITVGIAFLVHELAHKFTAQYYGKYAEFRANLTMLIAAVVLALLFPGFLIAAPGAVLVSGFVNPRQNGIISMAGPLSNIILALVILPFMFLVQGGIFGTLIGFGFLINAWLALFNLIPILPFDGSKIIRWNTPIYIAMVLVSVLLVFFAFRFTI